MKTYNRTNFHKHTFCIFTEVDATEIEHQKMNYISKSGSSYFFTTKGVYRKSNHWGRAANCKWRLQTIFPEQQSRTKIGFARWENFHSINESEKLYYIEADCVQKKVQYNHKNNSENSNVYLRNASETAKRVKQIRHFLNEDKSLQHFELDNPIEMQQKIVDQLISTDQTFIEIKRLLLD